MLPERTIGACRAAAAMRSRSSPDRPVVPMTWTMRAWAARAAISTVAAGAEKSTIPSAFSSSASGSFEIATPAAGRPASHARVLTERRRTRTLQRADQRYAGRLADSRDEHSSHATGGAGHDQPHVGHGANSCLSDPQPGCGPS